MAQVGWTRRAIADLEPLCVYVATDSPRMAEVLAGRILAAVDRLAVFPRSGRMVPEFERDDLREVIVSSYRVIYMLNDEAVQVVTIHHGARLMSEGDADEV